MSDVYGDEGDIGDGYFTPDRVDEVGLESFRVGAQMMREMIARFVDHAGDETTAISIRANWNPGWGEDPGKPSDADYEAARPFYDWAYFV